MEGNFPRNLTFTPRNLEVPRFWSTGWSIMVTDTKRVPWCSPTRSWDIDAALDTHDHVGSWSRAKVPPGWKHCSQDGWQRTGKHLGDSHGLATPYQIFLWDAFTTLAYVLQLLRGFYQSPTSLTLLNLQPSYQEPGFVLLNTTGCRALTSAWLVEILWHERSGINYSQMESCCCISSKACFFLVSA